MTCMGAISRRPTALYVRFSELPDSRQLVDMGRLPDFADS